MSTNTDELRRAKAKLEKQFYKKVAEMYKALGRLNEVRKELGEPERDSYGNEVPKEANKR